MRARGRRRVEQTRRSGAHAPLGRRGRRSRQPPASGARPGNPPPLGPRSSPSPASSSLQCSSFLSSFYGLREEFASLLFRCFLPVCVLLDSRVPVIDTWFFSGVRMGRGGSSQRVSPRFRRERGWLGLLPVRELRPVWKVVLTPPRVPFVSAAAGFDDRTEGLGPKPPRSRILRCLRWVGEQSPAPNTRSQPR